MVREARGRWARWWRKPHAGKPLGWRFGPRARTKNMFFMVVTLDVSQPDMSALKLVKLSNSPSMLVMTETTQLAMAPYATMAEDAFKSNAWTASFREAVLVKVPGGCEGGEGGEGGEGVEGGEACEGGEDGEGGGAQPGA